MNSALDSCSKHPLTIEQNLQQRESVFQQHVTHCSMTCAKPTGPTPNRSCWLIATIADFGMRIWQYCCLWMATYVAWQPICCHAICYYITALTSPRILLKPGNCLEQISLLQVDLGKSLVTIDCTAAVLGLSMGDIWMPSPCDSTLPTTSSYAYDTPRRMGSLLSQYYLALH